MDEAESYYYRIGDAAYKKDNLTKEELKWAKKLKLLNYFKEASWDENGKIIKKPFWHF